MIAAQPTNVLRLPEIMDLKAAPHLAEKIRAFEGTPLVFDASAVARLGALCLQVLLSARRTWADAKIPFGIRAPSPAFRDCAGLLGATTLFEAR